MAFTHVLTYNVSSTLPINRNVTVTEEKEINVAVAIPIAATDLLVEYVGVLDRLASFYMVCDQDITIKTNNATTPGVTLNTTKNDPFSWYPGQIVTLTTVFVVDITAFYITNGSGVAATFEIRSLIDPTP